MENLDERQMWAARYLRAIREVADGRVEQADAIRMAIFILYLELVGRLESVVPRIGVGYEFRAQAEALTREYAKVRSSHGLQDSASADFRKLHERGLAKLMQGVAPAEERADKVYRFDYLVDALLAETLSDTSMLRIEKFVASFSTSFISEGARLVDLGRHSSAELGTHALQAAGICLPNMVHGAYFEVLLKLEIHGCPILSSPFNGIDTLRQADFCLYLPPRKDELSAELNRARQEDLPGKSGLTMASWFVRHARTGQMAVTLLSVRDCRGVGIRESLRRDLIGTGNVRAVVELPRRAAVGNRQFLLLLDGRRSEMGEQEVMFVDGRACDVLRDEPLERIARFVSIPLLARRVTELDRVWPNWREVLGSELALRASRLFLGGQQEVRGLYCTVSPSVLLGSDSASLEPAAWIQPMELGNSPALLDPTPLRALFDSMKPCCAYVIGDNGVGKSFLLRGLVVHYVQAGRAVRALSFNPSDRFPATSNAMPSYRYLGARTTTNGSSPRALARQMLELLQVIHREPKRLAALEAVSTLVGFKGKHFVVPADGGTEAPDAALRGIDEVNISALRKGDRPGFQRSDTKMIVPFDHLSTGEQQMLLLLIRLAAEATPGVLFIIDEPEISLHVGWQRALPAVLNLVRDSFQAQFAIATHSPVLLSAALGASNHRFAARGGGLESLSDQASSVERILFEGFGTYTESNREVHERCAEIVSEAIERVNSGDLDFLASALGVLSEMRQTVERSIPALGITRTDSHLRLIERARLVLDGLSEESSAAEAKK